jgi:hypothetical protein
MGATVSVDELEVDPERFAVAGQTDRQSAIHLIKEQGAITLLPSGDPHLLTGPRRDKDLWLESGGCDMCRLGYTGW